MSNILFLLKVPPPLHGSTMMNMVVADSNRICSKHSKFFLKQSISSSVEDIGLISIKKIKKVLKNYISLITVLHNSKIDLVYFALSPKGMAFYKDLISILIIKFYRVKIIYHLHSKGIKDKSKNQIVRYLYKYAFKNEYCIVLADKLKEEVQDLGIKKIFVVPNGIVDNYNDSWEIVTDKFTITLIANYIPDKGIFDYLNILKYINEKGFDFIFNLIGQPKEIKISEIKSFINSNNLNEKLGHLGPLYGEDKFKALANSDLFIYPTKNDCYPLVLLEAMQFGLPVLSTIEGGIPDIIIDNYNGYLYPPENITEMKHKAVELMSDLFLHRKLSANSRNRYEHYNTLDKFEDNINTVFEEVLPEINSKSKE